LNPRSPAFIVTGQASPVLCSSIDEIEGWRLIQARLQGHYVNNYGTSPIKS